MDLATARPARGARYRLGQFRRALGAQPDAAALAEMRALLTPAQQRLFLQMAPRDQWHCIETLRLLPPALRADRDVAVAALLHDAGKGYIRLHERVLFVLLGRAPWLLRRIARPGGRGLRGALHRSLTHAETGAEMALRASASARTAALIRGHHAPPPGDPAALALSAADDRA
jgi:hypothetical protein